jgi:hypothetical protein
VVRLMALVRSEVAERFGVTLTAEVRLIGFPGGETRGLAGRQPFRGPSPP